MGDLQNCDFGRLFDGQVGVHDSLEEVSAPANNKRDVPSLDTEAYLRGELVIQLLDGRLDPDRRLAQRAARG